MPATDAWTAEEHEAGIVNWFSQNKRDRYARLLASAKGRGKFINTLYHNVEWSESVLHSIPPDKQNPVSILDDLRSRGAGQRCYCISTNSEIDGQFVDLKEALEIQVGRGDGTVLSLVPGKLGYYESEEQGGRYIICA